MPRTPLVFVILAVVCHLAGVGIGLAMGAAHDYSFRPVHAHVNLVGWVSLCLYGLIWRAWPDLGGAAARRTHLILAGTSALAFPAALALELSGGGSAPIALASIGWLAAAVWMLLLLLRRILPVFAGTPPGE